jgi:hypothetical protein
MVSFEHTDAENIDFVEQACWKMLSEGAVSRKSPMHTMVVGTAVGQHAFLRSVIIRRVDITEKRVYFHCDIRSAKIGEIRSTGTLTWLAYDPQLRSEIRLSGKTSVHHLDELCREHWASTKHFSRRCYLLPEGPGRNLGEKRTDPEEKLSNFQYSFEESEAGFDQFAVICTEVEWMGWYFTFSKGNRRASFKYDHGILQEAVWLTP